MGMIRLSVVWRNGPRGNKNAPGPPCGDVEKERDA